MLLCGRGSKDVFGIYRDPWGVSLHLMAGGQMEQPWPQRVPSATLAPNEASRKSWSRQQVADLEQQRCFWGEAGVYSR